MYPGWTHMGRHPTCTTSSLCDFEQVSLFLLWFPYLNPEVTQCPPPGVTEGLNGMEYTVSMHVQMYALMRQSCKFPVITVF